MSAKAKTVKMIGRKHFTLELMETEAGAYYIVSEVRGQKYFSEPITDLKIALFNFDSQLIKLEGN